MNELKCFFTRAFDYKGKSNRKEFLIPVLFFIALPFLFWFLDEGLDVDDDIITPLQLIATFAYLVPFVSLCVRRLHDTLHSGWWTLMLLVPIGQLIFIVYLAAAPGIKETRSAAASEAGDAASGEEPPEKTYKKATPAQKGCFIAAMAFGILLPALGVLGSVGLVFHDYAVDVFRNVKIKAQLKNMRYLLDDYQKEHGVYPILVAGSDDYGVKDLFPMFEQAKRRPKLEVLLQPPGRGYSPFSKDLTFDDFDTKHIGWAYNAKARPGTKDPLLSEGGVSHGRLFGHGKRMEGVYVLLADGDIVYVRANGFKKEETKHLSTHFMRLLPSDTVEDWSVLRE